MEETAGEVWKALLTGFSPEEKESLTKLVENTLREQRAEVLREAAQEAAGVVPRRRRGRPRKRTRG